MVQAHPLGHDDHHHCYSHHHCYDGLVLKIVNFAGEPPSDEAHDHHIGLAMMLFSS